MTWATDRPNTTRATRTMRAQVLAEEPTCRATGCDLPSTEDDHIVPWSQREAAGMTVEQWQARPNHQGLCVVHHRKKTEAEAKASKARKSVRRPSRRHPSAGNGSKRT